MPTIRQQKAVEALVENGGIVSRAMITAGYTPATAKTPQKLTQSQGFLEICEAHGLTPKRIIRSLVRDIVEKPGDRVRELELGAKMLGMAHESGININLDQRRIIITREDKPLPGATNALAEESSSGVGEVSV